MPSLVESPIPAAWLLRQDDPIALQLVANAFESKIANDIAEFLDKMIPGDELWYFDKNDLTSIWDRGAQKGYVIKRNGEQVATIVTEYDQELIDA
jgi:hypothetical protein